MGDPLVEVIEEVRRDLGFKESEDRLAAILMCELLAGRGLRLRDVPVGREVVVVGAGPSVRRLPKVRGELEGRVVYAADGACEALLRVGIVPDVVVTDLDGRVEFLLMAVEEGAVPVVHAHGDNVERLARWVPVLADAGVLGTCQVDPPCRDVVNPGGFTDGDRAVVLAARRGARRVLTVGMDFGDLTTEFSRPGEGRGVFRADRIKRRKLRWGERIVRMVRERLGVEVVPLV